uniref:Peptidase S8/S53 domain-containing protein n=1 Tax=Setaria digitata TaxID=48799 RepID=A0A915Q197_9BILA
MKYRWYLGVEDAYIVTYDGYYRVDIRHSIIKEAVRTTVNIEPRPILLSDFDVVEVSACNSTIFIQSLQRSVRTIRVTSNSRFTTTLRKKQLLTRRRHSGGIEIRHVTKLLNVDKLWDMGYKGQGVKVAVFDTGLGKHHPHFRQIVERTDWTNEQTADDGLGHGTFVAGLIASSDHKCNGFAPAASIYAYKVFTKKQVSFTSWFLDAFNHAILRGINILNLSIGGPDFTDLPFMDKVWELTANGIILISAIGNDGPKFGTLNNPADQMDVIGVGGINFDSKIARFSSRGMTTWELPVYGSGLNGDCRALSGTSVASPVVAGAVAVMLRQDIIYDRLIYSYFDQIPHLGIEDKRLWNPAVVKQALIKGASRLPNVATMFEQGAGKMNVLASFQFMRRLIPPYIDFNECPYMWPYCSQPLYASALPTIINVTIVNGMGVSGRIVEEPVWEPLMDERGDLLNISIMYSDLLWPWSGYMAVAINVVPSGYNYDGTASGKITVTVVSEERGKQKHSSAQFLIRVRIIPTPPRSQRLLWDQYRNIRYPPGYFPRDDLRDKTNVLDWNADHPHTNFKPLYQHLRSSGYYIEVLGEPLTCVDLSQYSAYLLVDPEDEFFPSERQKLYFEVNNANLNLIIFADWYNESVVDKIKFMDENTKQWWQPETGGTNLPALNDLLEKWNISLSAHVLDGIANIGNTVIKYLSGTSIANAPTDALIALSSLIDLGAEMIADEKSDKLYEEAIFVYYKNATSPKTSGFVAVFGDSTCLEVGATSDTKSCIFLLEALLESALEGDLITSLRQSLKTVIMNISTYAEPVYRKESKCRVLPASVSQPVNNVTLSSDLNRDLLKDDRSDLADENQLTNEVTPVQLHEIVQFFDENAKSNVERMHSLSFTDRNYGFLLLAFISSFIIVMYYRIVMRRFPDGFASVPAAMTTSSQFITRYLR